MLTSRRGFTLLEVMTALVLLTLSSILALRASLSTTEAVSFGRRWTAMAQAAESELARLERDYRRDQPLCAVPGSGSRYTDDGVRLDWRVVGDSSRVAVLLEARARSGRRFLADSVATTLRCR